MAAESEVSFGELDGSSLQIGVLRTRWNDEHVSNLVDGIKVRIRYAYYLIGLGDYCAPLSQSILAHVIILVWTQRMQCKRRQYLYQRGTWSL